MTDRVLKAKGQYRKDKTQTTYEKNVFVDPLKKRVKKGNSGRSRGIKLPKYIVFKLDDSGHLLIDIQEQSAIKPNGESIRINATCNNMQTDNAAFEGWAVCLKAWFPDKIHTVSLKWDIPSDEMRNPHYNRFLFRAWRFAQLYDWFTIEESNNGEIITFENTYNHLSINCSNSDPLRKGNLENRTEYDFVKVPSIAEKFKSFYGIKNFDHQLHVGIKNKGKQFFTGGQSAIDLWGRSNNVLTVIELKYDNIMVGIISELFLYICVVISLAKGEISAPESCILEHESELYANIKSVNSFKAEMLADEYHPLLENNGILDILNNNNAEGEGFKLHFGKTSFSYNEITKALHLSCE